MNINEIKQLFLDTLDPLFPLEEIGSFFNITASHYLGYSRFDVAMKASEVVSKAHEQQFLNTLERLQQQVPIQYILGTSHFYGLDFKVNKHTLIPRPETEELVQWILDDLSGVSGSPLSILDMGTGSGCIAVSLAKHLQNAQVSALDISEETLKIARENAEFHQQCINFFQADMLALKTLPDQYHVIVSNPPYVRALEKNQMQDNVLLYEPEQALYVPDDDPLLFYRSIARLAVSYLKKDGILFFEINEYLSEQMREMLLQEGFTSVVLKNDLYGKPRMIKAER